MDATAFLSVPNLKAPPRDEIYPEEYFWRDKYNWLRDRGYLLRDRYRPDWVASWKGKRGQEEDGWRHAEDGHVMSDVRVADANRMSDGMYVAIKRLYDEVFEQEVAVKFSSSPLAEDPRNHCVPVLQVMEHPESPSRRLMVTPLLREYGNPAWDTIGEVVGFFEQIFEGVHFMHINHTAHRDCTVNNIMLDPSDMYPDSFHPAVIHMRRDLKGPAKHFTRTQRPPRYYLIDFGLSCTFDPKDGPPRILPSKGGDRSMPEFKLHPDDPYDPFPSDVYYLGNWVKQYFMKKFDGLEFMHDLVEDMVRDKPSARPTMAQVVARFNNMVTNLSRSALRSRLAKRGEDNFTSMCLSVGYWRRRLIYTLMSVPPIPRPVASRPPPTI